MRVCVRTRTIRLSHFVVWFQWACVLAVSSGCLSALLQAAEIESKDMSVGDVQLVAAAATAVPAPYFPVEPAPFQFAAGSSGIANSQAQGFRLLPPPVPPKVNQPGNNSHDALLPEKVAQLPLEPLPTEIEAAVPEEPIRQDQPLLLGEQNDMYMSDTATSPLASPTQSPNDLRWWKDTVSSTLRPSATTRVITVESLLTAALFHSAQIRVLSDSPLIKETAITEAMAEFDWTAFMQTNWNDISEPVGSTLTTGGPPRFSNEQWDYDLGVRRTTRSGGQFQMSQKEGWEKSNSVFFIPNKQGTTRLTLSYTQPILRGAGKAYNSSLIVLAELDSGIAHDDFATELQGHLQEVVKAYWSLYLERAALLQRHRLYRNGLAILDEIRHRQQIDVVQNQVIRAEAAIAARKANLYRAATAVKNAEARIRALVNAPDLGRLDECELATADSPFLQPIQLCLPDTVETAMRHRPEVAAGLKQIQASSVRRDMTQRELLPALDLVMETYVAGLRGNSDIAGSFTDQFQDGAPSYTTGIKLEAPIFNRAAKARHQRRQLEVRQFQSQLQAILAALQLEVEIGVREVETSYRELEAKLESVRASGAELEYITQRWRLLPSDDRTASMILEDLLAAQERLTSEESGLLRAEVNYNLAIMDLKRITGTLLELEAVSVQRTEDGGVPLQSLSKPPLEWGPPETNSAPSQM